MYPVPGICPVCGDELSVTKLHCNRCDTNLEGLFTLGRFHYLTREQQQFIAVFVKCRGKIKDVEEALDISYPTVVARLDEVIGALGFAEPAPVAPRPVPQTTVTVQSELETRRVVLDELSKGHITSEEALALLRGQDIAPEPRPAPRGDGEQQNAVAVVSGAAEDGEQ